MSTLMDLQHVSESFDGEMMFDDLNLTTPENSSVTLLGPSGCGKATTLHAPGDPTTPDSGKVIFDRQDVTSLPSNRRQLNMVLQKYVLLPHMSTAGNIAFGLKIRGESKAYIGDKIHYALKLVNLSGFKKRDVNSPSGGQRQRITVAHAIINEPRFLLLGEPLSTLDLKFHQNMQYELIHLKKELGIVFVCVTHNREEALTMSGTIVVMNQDYTQQMSTPRQIYNEPESTFVAGFIGDSNTIGAAMVYDGLVNTLSVNFHCVNKGFGQNKPADVVIHPENVGLMKPEDSILTGHAIHSIFEDVHYEMEVTTENDYEWLMQSVRMFELGQTVGITVDPFNTQIMNKPTSEGEEAIVNE